VKFWNRNGGVAERRGNGLQSRVHGFKSRLHLEEHHQRAIGAAVARFPDTEEVTGSIPVSPTSTKRPLTSGNASQGSSSFLTVQDTCRIARGVDARSDGLVELGAKAWLGVRVYDVGHAICHTGDHLQGQGGRKD
jgi:hypothetical protein